MCSTHFEPFNFPQKLWNHWYLQFEPISLVRLAMIQLVHFGAIHGVVNVWLRAFQEKLKHIKISLTRKVYYFFMDPPYRTYSKLLWHRILYFLNLMNLNTVLLVISALKMGQSVLQIMLTRLFWRWSQFFEVKIYCIKMHVLQGSIVFEWKLDLVICRIGTMLLTVIILIHF